MTSLNNERYKIADILGAMAEKVLKREPPFENIPVHPEACSEIYLRYLDCYNLMDNSLKRKVLKAEIDKAKFFFLKRLVGVNESFANAYPEHMETKKEFWVWSEKKIETKPSSSHFVGADIKKLPKNQITKIVKEVVLRKFPEFSHSKSKFFPGTITFKRNWNDRNLFILVDKGTKRKFLDFFIGLDKPLISVDIATFFSSAQSKYYYFSHTDLERSVEKACALIAFIMPNLERELTSAWPINSNSQYE